VHVTVRLSAHVARFAGEWPLAPTQTLEPQPDGAVIVHADVAGTVEAMRWVLRWGDGAEALSPPELRRAVHEQLASALDRYMD
jgi:predicted DNA-binding transcriptional regulator YafY